MAFVSYAQNLEDVMLHRAFANIRDGFYIDVGANDPSIDSVTKAFYDMGWTGINIEPDTKYYNKLIEARPRDINLNIVAGDKQIEVNFYAVSTRGLSTGIAEIADHYASMGQSTGTSKIEQIPLSNIFESHVSRDVHFLKIDVEGMELAVLSGLDFKKNRPFVLIVESIDPMTREDRQHEWEHILISAAYEFVYFDGINRYYLAVEKKELEKYFKSPPNVFDNYIVYRDLDSIDDDSLKLRVAKTNIGVQRQIIEKEKRIAEEIFAFMRADILALSEQKTKKIDDYNIQIKKMSDELVHAREQIKTLAAQLESSLSMERKLAEDLKKSQESLQNRDEIVAQYDEKLVDLEIGLGNEKKRANLFKSNSDSVTAQLANLESRFAIASGQLTEHSAEIQRLRRLLYSAPSLTHLYRAWRVFIGDSHYCVTHSEKPQGDTDKNKKIAIDDYSAGGRQIAAALHGNAADAKISTEDIIRSNNENLPKTAPSILILSTYPFQKPRHGGQLRLVNIVKSYQDSGWRVRTIAIYENAQPGDVGTNDIHFSPDSPYRLNSGENVPFTVDLQSGHYAVGEHRVYAKILTLLPEKLDAIHVEQPWLWPLAVKLKSKEKFAHLTLINGTQNIEWMLKKSIFDSYGVVHKKTIAAIKELEIRACAEADITLAVTKKDLDYFSKYIKGKSLLAPNGVEPWVATQEKLEEWRARLPKGPWFLYVASAHPPNFTGFLASLGDSLAAIPPDGKLVIAGSVCEHIYRILSTTKWHSLNISRLELLFELDSSDLEAIKSLAWAFILPISDGGGSNLKTAEALASGTSVIGTKQAFRGFEEYISSDGVFACETAEEFRTAMLKISKNEAPYRISTQERQRRRQLFWTECLAKLSQSIKNTISKNENNLA